MEIESVKHERNMKELLPQVIERIFAVCRTDDNFKFKDDLETIESKSKLINDKIEKQQSLLKQSGELKKDLLHRIASIDSQNEKQQINLLQSIGGEL